jgi:hypothetical protein
MFNERTPAMFVMNAYRKFRILTKSSNILLEANAAVGRRP